MRASVNGTDLYYECVGHGPPLVLMHGGLGLDHTYFRPFLDPLGETAELVYYDHRGNGRSREVTSWDQVDHAMLAADADALRAYLGHEQIILLGHSWGGFVAQEYATLYPNRLAGLILCHTAPALDYAGGGIRALLSAAGVEATDEQVETAEKLFTGAPLENDDVWRRAWTTVAPLYFKSPDPGLLARLDEGTIYRAGAWMNAITHCAPKFDVTGELGAVTAPALVIGGRFDWIAPPEQVERIGSLLPHAEQVVLEQSAHYGFIEEPDRFLAVVREWLERATRTAARP